MPSKRWSAGYYDAKGKRHRKMFATKIAAEHWQAVGKAEAAAEKAKHANKALSRVVAIQAAAESASR